MKILKLLFLTLVTSAMFTSCVITNDGFVDDAISLEELVSDYDLWYVDYHNSVVNENVPFLSKAFTISFLNGTMYANNNIVDIGRTGNGYGIAVGNYNTYRGFLEARHDLDGYYDFDVVQISANEIRIDYGRSSYYLVGYQKNNFDYNKLFHENIEYFLQEYVAWERLDALDGVENIFDEERFLQFTPEQNTSIFRTSQDEFGTNVANINWDFVGDYTVYDVNGYENLKGLTLKYSNGDNETFELSVIDDRTVQLYHQSSDTTYTFTGRAFVQYLRSAKKESKTTVRNSGRERTKIKRKTVDRKHLK